jgi:prepilin-type N-terminal cleavage/methylation domain-containing protein/prepilin-type processing-associated H-X9-DG protein
MSTAFSVKCQRQCAIPLTLVGFTIVELLVVVAIIGILIALLIPTLIRIKSKADDAYCLNNLRQIGIGLFVYAEHYESRLPLGVTVRGNIGIPAEPYPGGVWLVNEQIGGSDGEMPGGIPSQSRPLRPYVAPNAFRCPIDAKLDLRSAGANRRGGGRWAAIGSSYLYNGGGGVDIDTSPWLGGKFVDWVKKPAVFVMSYEQSALPIGMDPPKLTYLHGARRIGMHDGYLDDDFGPRKSPILFVDGHVNIIDFTFSYAAFAPHPVEWKQH